MRRRHRARRALGRSLRTACALCVAGLSLSNAPAGQSAAALGEQQVRIALAEVRSELSSASEASRSGRALVRCRSHLDGSFSALIDATAARIGTDAFTHIVTDVTRVERSAAQVAMIFQTRDARGRKVVREARATIDLASCVASDVSVPSL